MAGPISPLREPSPLMTLACKGYTSASEIETFDSNAKHKALNGEKR